MSVDISNYVTNTTSNVFCLKNLPEEVVAFLFARYSRSKLSLKKDLQQMLETEDLDSLIDAANVQKELDESFEHTQAKARTFAEKYVLGYSHQSVAEHSILHIALEDISIIASKFIEDSRLASYTEKSTRYVQFDVNKMTSAEDLKLEGDAAKIYQDTTQSLMNAYLNWLDPFVDKIKENTPKKEKQSENGYNTSCRATAFDSLRYLLPSATHTNLGMTVNARELANIIVKMRSSHYIEVRMLAEKIKQEAEKIVPTLLKYADKSDYIEEMLTINDYDNEEKLQFRNNVKILEPYFSQEDAMKLLCYPDKYIQGWPIADNLTEHRGKFENFSRPFERVPLTFEMYMDFGAYRDIQRHRMATLTMCGFKPLYGYEIPRGIEEFGYAKEYNKLMKDAVKAYNKLHKKFYYEEAKYVLPLAQRVRVIATMNLRELQHFIELRSGRQGHYSYRDVAQQTFREVEKIYPDIAKHMRPDMNDYSLTRDEK